MNADQVDAMAEAGLMPTSDARSFPMRAFTCALDAVSGVSEAAVVVAIAVDLVITFANMMRRYLFGSSWDWSFDLIAISLSAIAFVGGAAAFRRGHRPGRRFTALGAG